MASLVKDWVFGNTHISACRPPRMAHLNKHSGHDIFILHVKLLQCLEENFNTPSACICRANSSQAELVAGQVSDPELNLATPPCADLSILCLCKATDRNPVKPSEGLVCCQILISLILRAPAQRPDAKVQRLCITASVRLISLTILTEACCAPTFLQTCCTRLSVAISV